MELLKKTIWPRRGAAAPLTALVVSVALCLLGSSGCGNGGGLGSPWGTQNPQLTLSPSSVNFGDVIMGRQKTQTITASNTGTGEVTISQASSTGSGFRLSGPSLPVTLAAGQSAKFSVTFAPAAAGAATGSVSIVSSAANSPATVPLSGAAESLLLSVTPASLNFRVVGVGSKTTLPLLLTNTGTGNVNVALASVTGSGFSLSGPSLPVTLAAGQSAKFSVTFAPAGVEAATGSVSIVSDATNSPATVSLTGTADSLLLSPAPASLSFGVVGVGSKVTLPLVLTNTGTGNVTISQASATGNGFRLSGASLPVSLPSGASAKFSVTFAPAAAGAATGSVSIASDATNSPAIVSLSGSAESLLLSAAPASLSFGDVVLGSKATLAVLVTNAGTGSVTISQVAVAGAGFSVDVPSLPLALAPGTNTALSVSFAPVAAGSAAGSLSVVSSAQNSPLAEPLSGAGENPSLQLTLSPSSLNFGDVTVGSEKTQTITASNAGTGELTISQASAAGSGFSVSGPSLPVSLAPGQSTNFSVTFAPAAAGAATGSVSIASNAANSPATIALSGTGAGHHSVDLSWLASASGDVVGYYVYRGTTPGGPYTKLNSQPVSGAPYSDTTVEDGQTYYYVTTAVDFRGVESVYSNEAKAPIPSF
jgi:Abnormal spindle-like microcephaly-assoc'd, ASPM-SPD-2-Hydin